MYMESKRSFLAIIYASILIAIAAIVLRVYLFNIMNDDIARLYVFKFSQFGEPNFTVGSPMVPIFIGMAGIFTILASNIRNRRKTISYGIGIIPLVLFVFATFWLSSMLPILSTVPFPRSQESSGIEFFIMLGALWLGILALIPLIISLFSVLKNRTYLFSFGVILLISILLQIGLTLATLPGGDSSIVSEAAKEGDASICYNILEGGGRNKCFQQVAFSTLKVEHCYLIPESYGHVYSGPSNTNPRVQCVADFEKAESNPIPNNPLRFISDHGFSLDFPSDWKDYRYSVHERKVPTRDKHMQLEYPNGYNIISYVFGIYADDNVFEINIYGADHWESGIAIASKSRAKILGYKDNFVYVTWEGSKTGFFLSKSDDVDSIIESFRIIDIPQPTTAEMKIKCLEYGEEQENYKYTKDEGGWRDSYFYYSPALDTCVAELKSFGTGLFEGYRRYVMVDMFEYGRDLFSYRSGCEVEDCLTLEEYQKKKSELLGEQ